LTFEEYWETDGSRKDAADHKERARLAWMASRKIQAQDLYFSLGLSRCRGDEFGCRYKIKDVERVLDNL